MEIGKSFSYSFEDQNWINKYLLTAIISIVPILNFAVQGYQIDIIRNVMDSAEKPLPDWSDLGDKFVKGLVLFLAQLIYAIPALILIGISVTAIIVPASAELEDVAVTMFTGAGVVLICLLSAYLLAMSFFYPAMYIHYARKNTFGSCFEIGKIIKIATSNFGPYITAWLVIILAGIGIGILAGVVSTILGFIPCIGWIAAVLISAGVGVWLIAVSGHLFGQVGALNKLYSA